MWRVFTDHITFLALELKTILTSSKWPGTNRLVKRIFLNQSDRVLTLTLFCYLSSLSVLKFHLQKGWFLQNPMTYDPSHSNPLLVRAKPVSLHRQWFFPYHCICWNCSQVHSSGSESLESKSYSKTITSLLSLVSESLRPLWRPRPDWSLPALAPDLWADVVDIKAHAFDGSD